MISKNKRRVAQTIGLTPSRARVARVLYARGPRGMRLCGASNYLNPVNIPRNKRGERKEEEEEEEEEEVGPVGDGWNAARGWDGDNSH